MEDNCLDVIMKWLKPYISHISCEIVEKYDGMPDNAHVDIKLPHE